MQYEFTDQEMQVIVTALGELPVKFALPVLNSINAQRAPKPNSEIPAGLNESKAPGGAEQPFQSQPEQESPGRRPRKAQT